MASADRRVRTAVGASGPHRCLPGRAPGGPRGDAGVVVGERPAQGLRRRPEERPAAPLLLVTGLFAEARDARRGVALAEDRLRRVLRGPARPARRSGSNGVVSYAAPSRASEEPPMPGRPCPAAPGPGVRQV
ncbi:hypothetical protein ABZ611_23115 [Streptomyces sp. NPDC007861]|uniref:hypothetical protein n=1 Tax=Streptomyces sp. NPDC007861 TaxID=3154893 RepID=UPI0033FA6EF3